MAFSLKIILYFTSFLLCKAVNFYNRRCKLSLFVILPSPILLRYMLASCIGFPLGFPFGSRLIVCTMILVAQPTLLICRTNSNTVKVENATIALIYYWLSYRKP